jgi:putative spermidine/putrescine transport system permease protein
MRFLALSLGVVTVVYVVVFVVPMLFMVAVSLGQTRLATPALKADGLFGAYKHFWGDSYYRSILVHSLRLAVLAVLVTLVVGMPLAYTAIRGSRLYRVVALFAVLNPLFVNTIVRLFGLQMALDRVNLDASFTGVLIGTVQILLPFMVIPLMTGFRDLDPLMIHSARTLGSGRLRIAFRIALPILAPAILAGSVLVFILAMNIFTIPLVLGKPEDPTMALLVYQAALGEADFTFAAAVAMILLVMTLIVIFLQGRIVQRLSRSVVV